MSNFLVYRTLACPVLNCLLLHLYIIKADVNDDPNVPNMFVIINPLKWTLPIFDAGLWLLCCVLLWLDADRFILHMMTSSNGNIFRVTGHLCGEFTGPGEFPAQRPVARSFDVFFDLCLNKRLSKQSWGWWCETLSRSLWRHRNVNVTWLVHMIARVPLKTTLKNMGKLARIH